MSTHTPGPWYIGERSSYHGMSFIEIHSAAKIGNIKMPAHLLGPVARTDKENSRLIAAAPDLLDALQALHDRLDGLVHAGMIPMPAALRAQALNECVESMRDQVAVAIAKATGEAA